MHVNKRAFNEDRDDVTVESVNPKIPSEKIGQRLGLSIGDMLKINKAYVRENNIERKLRRNT